MFWWCCSGQLKSMEWCYTATVRAAILGWPQLFIMKEHKKKKSSENNHGDEEELFGWVPSETHVRPKLQLKCFQFTFWGRPRTLGPEYLLKIYRQPFFGEVCYSFNSRGWIDKRPPCTHETPKKTCRVQEMGPNTKVREGPTLSATPYLAQVPTMEHLLSHDTLPTGILMAL